MLLGAVSGTKVSRYENFTRMPGAITVFAFEIVFNQPRANCSPAITKRYRSRSRSAPSAC